MENKEVSENEMVFNFDIKRYLLETAKWGKFMAILGFIGLAVMLIMSLLMLIGVSFLDSLFKTVPMFVFGLMYLIFTVLYFFPTTYLYRFSKKIKQGVLTDDEAVMTNGFNHLKNLFRFMGILMIVMLSMYALIALIAVPSVLFARFA